MFEEQKDRRCARAGCPCPADPGNRYCSDECSTSDGSASAKCTCAHEVCQQAQVTTREGIRDGSYDPAESIGDKEKPLLDDWGKSDKH
jgi:hypothetical protein